jgi:hypothetical protein
MGNQLPRFLGNLYIKEDALILMVPLFIFYVYLIIIFYKGKTCSFFNNKLVEVCLGKLGVLCVEDLIYEIEKCGKNVKKILKYLMPFKLSSPPKPFPKIAVPYSLGGDYGDRGSEITELLALLN